MGYVTNSTLERRTELKAKKSMPRSTKHMKRTAIKKKREPPALIRWRRECRVRDAYRCQFPGCPAQSKRIDVHHKAKRSQRPDLVFDVDNGICLCREHHDWTDRNHDEAVRLGLLDLTTYELAKKQEREAA